MKYYRCRYPSVTYIKWEKGIYPIEEYCLQGNVVCHFMKVYVHSMKAWEKVSQFPHYVLQEITKEEYEKAVIELLLTYDVKDY